MMSVTSIDVWSAPVRDESGGLAAVLAPVAMAGADLEFIAARRESDKPGEGVVFIAPLEGREQHQAAERVGFRPAEIGMVRVEGPDSPGVAAALMQELLAASGLSIRGASAVARHRHCCLYLAFDSREEAEQAAEILQHANV